MLEPGIMEKDFIQKPRPALPFSVRDMWSRQLNPDVRDNFDRIMDHLTEEDGEDNEKGNV